MKSPYDMDAAQLADLVAAIQQKLYLEQGHDRGFIWNPGKDLDCRGFVEELDELMGDNGLHPKEAESKRTSPRGPSGVGFDESLSGMKRNPDLSINSGRLIGYISPNFKLSDVVFPPTSTRILLMSRRDVEDLRGLCDQLLEYLKD
jgi:hypothetical protein